MKTEKMLMILFALISVAATAQVSGSLPAQQTKTIRATTYTTWCISNKDSSLTKLRWEVSWACGNGADCSPIEKGGHCQDLSFTDQASYAFNDYYQKDPKHGTCYFDGAAEIAIKDPSTPTCKFPSNSTTTWPPTSSVTRAAVPNLGSFLWGLGFTYLAYVAAQIA